jgi:ferritin
MQIGERVRAAMNDQINHEFDSAYRYLAMSAWCERRDLPGCARWLRRQAEEEVVHAMKFFDYIQARDGAVLLQTLPQPPADFPDVNAVFAGALAHERHITALIHSLFALATSEGDFASQQFLQWFLAEQVEEEESASAVVARLALAGEHNVGLLLIDQELGKRGGEGE